ncbi:MAG: guanylate cyclase, partial [Burkholderiales bacterium]|nr:guanylate cyclase [Burkholderiales bacterium]
MQSIRQWLESIGLEQYAEAFEENDVDAEILRDLSEDDLQRLGVSLGHRKRMLRAMQADASTSEASPRQEPGPIESTTIEGERRQVTVLFCDLVGSTALSARLDPEAYRAVLSRYHQTAIHAIQRFDGYAAQIQGDGILAYFGYPLAHEGEADRAVRAGLEIIAALKAGNGSESEALRVRIGIASGLVVVSHVLAPEKSAVGETPNLAHRLQAAAQPDEVIVSTRTQQLAGRGFEYEDRGLLTLKGVASLVRAYRVLGRSTAASRFDAAMRGQLTPLIGRDQEVGLLLDRWSLSHS